MGDLAFDFEGQGVRVVLDESGAPWWIAKDVCACLEVGNHRHAISRLAADERGSLLTTPLGGPQKMLCVNEPGLYRLIFSSRKPAADRFKRWLAHDVLPSLRRTGRYEIPNASVPATPPMELPDQPAEWLAMIREARLNFGRRAGQRLWELSPLPTVKPAQTGSIDDHVTDFLNNCCEITGDAGDFVWAGDLVKAYLRYARDNGRIDGGARAASNAILRVVRSAEFRGLVWRLKRCNVGYAGLFLRGQ